MNIKFAISSNIKFYKKTYNILVDSLIKNKINEEDIYFFIGGYSKYNKINLCTKKTNVYETDHNSIDFTGLISLIDLNIQSKYWFVMHDTCYAGDTFFEKLNKFKINNKAVIPLYNGASMNMGLYSQSYINSKKVFLLSVKNKNYDEKSLQAIKKKNVEIEDYLLKPHKNYTLSKSCVTSKPVDFYNNGVSRIIEHYEEIDFYKVKANWLVKSEYELNL